MKSFVRPVAGSLAFLLGLLLSLASQSQAATRLDRTVLEDGQGLMLSITFPELERETVEMNGLQFLQMAMGDLLSAVPAGAPELPVYSQLLELPDRSDIQVELVDMVVETIENVHPWPSQEVMHTEAELPLVWHQDEAIYSSSAPWPASRIELGEPALMRNLRVVSLHVYPVQYFPAAGRIEVLRSASLRVTYEGENLTNAREFVLNDPTPVLARSIKQQVLAHPMNSQLDEALSSGPWFDPGRLPGHYIVFAKQTALAQSPLMNLLDWKRRRGHKVTIVDETEISWTATEIRTRIIEEYTGPDPVDYVLLIGDVDGSYALPTDNSSYDHYFAKIEGNDILGDVAVGRLSVDTATQLAAVCNKIIGYESDPFTLDDEWLHRAGLTVGSSVCAMSMKILSRNIGAELVQRRGYTDIDTAFCSGSSHVDDWFIEGLSFYSYRGWIGMEGLSCTTVQNLQQGPQTPVATIFTCSTGDFNFEDDFTECFLRGGTATTPGGAVAAMGFATASTHTRYNNVVVGGYYHGLLEYDTPEIGACLLQGKYELYANLPPSEQGSASSFANWGNLMGDPGTCQWAGALPVPELDGYSDTLPSGANHVAYTLSSGGDPIANAAVCVWQLDGATETVHHVGLTDEEGMIILPLDGLVAGELMVTVTHHRYRPLLNTVTIEGGLAADPTVSSWDMSNNAVYPGSGAQSLSIDLHNNGSSAMTGITVDYTLDAAYGSLAGNAQSIASLAAGETITLDAIDLSSSSMLVDGSLVPVLLAISSTEGSFSNVAWLPVDAPLPTVTATGTPDGPLAPGEVGAVSITLDNMGSRDAQSLLVSLTSATPFYGQVASAPQNGGTVAPGSGVTLEFDILVSELTMVGFPLLLDLEWSTSDGAEGATQVSVIVGTPSSGDPTGPDGYGYWAYEDDDDTYDLAPEFDWVAITSGEGGAGTNLGLSDVTEEDEDATWVDLPFDFTYYGETYSEVMICTNGFISFAENGFGELNFRNHYFPSGMGPDAMIAPMWDDHLTTGGGGVWTWFDEANHAFVVTWWAVPAYSSGGPNTFQIILYDPLHHPTMTGDGPYKFQYLDFNDTQSAGADFPMCSIGMKDHNSTIGMTLLNFGVYHQTMHTITDNTAIFFTTSAGSNLAPPAVELSDTQFEIDLTSGDSGADSIMVRNLGELPLMWAMSLQTEDRDQGGPDDFGYVWMDNSEEDGPVYAWEDHEDKIGVSFANHDALSDWIDLGFTVYLYGQAFNRFRISPNGYVVFNTDTGDHNNLELPSEDAPSYMIAAWWDDLKPFEGDINQVWYWTDGEDRLVVSWDNVPHFNPFVYGGPVKAQFALRSGGELKIQVASTGGQLYPVNESGTVGVQGEPGVEGFTFFHNEDASAHLPWAVRMTPPAWVMTRGSVSGSVAALDSTWIGLDFTSVPGFPLPDGDYTASVLLTTNDLDNMQTTLPVIMHVSGNDVESAMLPTATKLGAAWPNPFNPSTRLDFDLAQSGDVSLKVYNLRGQLAATLLDARPFAAGSHSLVWNASSLSSGLYIAVLESGTVRDEMKLMLLK